jgi:uncharacterized protein YdeI (YjbR/CyaY-like superfamily)
VTVPLLPPAARPFRTRASWRAWLSANHAKAKEVWLLYYKKGSEKTSVTYAEALEEALCFGWIDSTVRKVDAERYAQRYTPRKITSIWSARNKALVRRLKDEGRMTEAGWAKVLAARRNGRWRALDKIDVHLEPPEDFLLALERAGAREAFNRLPGSPKKQFVWWIVQAKRAETRERRIAVAVSMVRAGRRPGIEGMRLVDGPGESK